jgi:2-oxoglutarate ferredoxin oxidoreductase subunit gamma
VSIIARAPKHQTGAVTAAQEPAAVPARAGLLADRDFVEVRFGGSGGQGVVLMGIILAVAANRDCRCVVQTESYGPEARGGHSRSDVIISDNPIDYPKLDQADLFVALSQAAATGYVKTLRKDGILIYDSERVVTLPGFGGTIFGVPFTRLAKEETGRAQTANVLTLGAVVGITGVVSVESIHKAVFEAVPRGTTEVNGKALAKGLSLNPAEWRVVSPPRTCS